MTTSRSNADVDRRRFLGVSAFEAVLLIAGHVGAGYRSQSGTGSWLNEQQVMLLRTIHLAISEAGAGGDPMLRDTGGNR